MTIEAGAEVAEKAEAEVAETPEAEVPEVAEVAEGIHPLVWYVLTATSLTTRPLIAGIPVVCVGLLTTRLLDALRNQLPLLTPTWPLPMSMNLQ